MCSSAFCIETATSFAECRTFSSRGACAKPCDAFKPLVSVLDRWKVQNNLLIFCGIDVTKIVHGFHGSINVDLKTRPAAPILEAVIARLQGSLDLLGCVAGLTERIFLELSAQISKALFMGLNIVLMALISRVRVLTSASTLVIQACLDVLTLVC